MRMRAPRSRSLVEPRREARLFRLAAVLVILFLLDDAFAHPEAGTSASEHLGELRASVRTKIVLLASAYDCQYGDSYCRRIAKNPQRFGDYELSRA